MLGVVTSLTLKNSEPVASPSLTVSTLGSNLTMTSSCSPGGRALTFSGMSHLKLVCCNAARPDGKEMGMWPLLVTVMMRDLMLPHST